LKPRSLHWVAKTEAKTPFGTYSIVKYVLRASDVFIPYFDGESICVADFPTEEQAIATCQRDFDRRMADWMVE
jgi:hypothetical protein